MYLIQHEKYIKNNNWWWLWMWKESGNGRAAGAQVSYNARLNSTQPRGVCDAISIPVLAPSLPYPLPSVNGFYVSSPLSFAIGGCRSVWLESTWCCDKNPHSADYTSCLNKLSITMRFVIAFSLLQLHIQHYRNTTVVYNVSGKY